MEWVQAGFKWVQGTCMAPVQLHHDEPPSAPLRSAANDGDSRGKIEQRNVEQPEFWLDQQPDGATGLLGTGRKISRSLAGSSS